MRGPARQFLAAAAAVALWQAWAAGRHSAFFPPPVVIAGEMRRQWFSGPAAHLFLTAGAVGNVLPSVTRMLAGLTLSAAAAIPLGIALGRSRTAAAFLSPVLEFARAVPVVTAAPVFIAVLGIGDVTEVAVIAAGTAWPLLLNAAAGAAAVDPLHLETAVAFRLSARRRLTAVIIPSALPGIAAGLRLSLSAGLVLMVFSELAGATDGIGYELATAAGTFNLPLYWACLVLLAVLGYLLNVLAGFPGRRLLRWHHDSRRAAP
ncbi:MAG TPA: ABC transporter permease subunit [Trebonia sp.]|nr:ABC transporter permease subunit [Trebonia sp.]